MKSIFYNRTLKALRLQLQRGYEISEIVDQWNTEAANESPSEAEEMRKAIDEFKKECLINSQ